MHLEYVYDYLFNCTILMKQSKPYLLVSQLDY